jgi:hypothetical protein
LYSLAVVSVPLVNVLPMRFTVENMLLIVESVSFTCTRTVSREPALVV